MKRSKICQKAHKFKQCALAVMILIVGAMIASNVLAVLAQEESTQNLSGPQRQRLRQFIQRRRAQRGRSSGEGANSSRMGDGRFQSPSIDPAKVDARFNIPYGKDERQKLDLYIPKVLKAPAPILVFVHGGGWRRGSKDLQRSKGVSYAENGIVTICTNYRLAPDVMHPKQVEDVAAAVSWAKQHATEYGANPERIFVMGHSAGAHLVDLLGTNDRFLKQYGLSLADIKGVISLDTASLNLLERGKENTLEGNMVGDMIKQAFGTDPDVLAD
ncbi:alpha/beta hydrolase, partial [Candidatus Obscuribacterales bacterium]|nr:alpha/beta hydrolase [Candidatus Obscuribacterales bacterium]